MVSDLEQPRVAAAVSIIEIHQVATIHYRQILRIIVIWHLLPTELGPPHCLRGVGITRQPIRTAGLVGTQVLPPADGWFRTTIVGGGGSGVSRRIFCCLRTDNCFGLGLFHAGKGGARRPSPIFPWSILKAAKAKGIPTVRSISGNRSPLPLVAVVNVSPLDGIPGVEVIRGICRKRIALHGMRLRMSDMCRLLVILLCPLALGGCGGNAARPAEAASSQLQIWVSEGRRGRHNHRHRRGSLAVTCCRVGCPRWLNRKIRVDRCGFCAGRPHRPMRRQPLGNSAERNERRAGIDQPRCVGQRSSIRSSAVAGYGVASGHRADRPSGLQTRLGELPRPAFLRHVAGRDGNPGSPGSPAAPATAIATEHADLATRIIDRLGRCGLLICPSPRPTVGLARLYVEATMARRAAIMRVLKRSTSRCPRVP